MVLPRATNSCLKHGLNRWSNRYWLRYDFITPKMIEARGYGEERPIVANDTPENKQLNRRIEVLVWE